MYDDILCARHTKLMINLTKRHNWSRNYSGGKPILNRKLILNKYMQFNIKINLAINKNI